MVVRKRRQETTSFFFEKREGGSGEGECEEQNVIEEVGWGGRGMSKNKKMFKETSDDVTLCF